MTAHVVSRSNPPPGAMPQRRAVKPARARGQAGAVGQILRTLARHPGRTFAGGLLAISLCAVSVNALYLQTGVHPRPLASPISAPTTPRTAGSAQPPVKPSELRAPAFEATMAVPKPPPAPAQRTAGTIATSNAPPATVSPATLAPSTLAPAKPRDAIADMIRVSAGPSPAAQPAGGEIDVAAVQRALNRLGYGPLEADGVMGPGTRRAIERLQIDRKLQGTGEIGPRTARELGVTAGRF